MRSECTGKKRQLAVSADFNSVVGSRNGSDDITIIGKLGLNALKRAVDETLGTSLQRSQPEPCDDKAPLLLHPVVRARAL